MPTEARGAVIVDVDANAMLNELFVQLYQRLFLLERMHKETSSDVRSTYADRRIRKPFWLGVDIPRHDLDPGPQLVQSHRSDQIRNFCASVTVESC